MNQQTVKHTDDLASIVGREHLLIDQASKEAYGRDWTTKYKPSPLAVAFPASRDELSALLCYCHANNVSVVPSGGRTGLAAAAVAANNELVISLQRMNKIIAIDDVGLTAEVEAGVTTQALQEAAKKAGLFFALDLAAKGSSHIGGNIATNAGGLKFIRYGGMREQVLGLEVVLADGTILDLNTAVRKNNTGYDLKQLFIGSEGTLGIISKATLKLLPPPGELRLCCFAISDFSSIPKLLQLTARHRMPITAFEYYDRSALETVLQYMPQCRNPFEDIPEFSVLIESEEDGEGGCFDRFIEEAFDSGFANDGVVASTSQQFQSLWALRENISEAVTNVGFVYKNDVSVAIAKLESFVSYLKTLMAQCSSDVSLITFGHIGDGNLHLNYVAPKSLGQQNFLAAVRKIELLIFEKIRELKGSISAEHGVGLLKKDDLTYSVSSGELDFMRQIKATFDPKLILNPGKIFD